MRALTDSEKLRVWERGRRQTTACRALLMLAAATPEISSDELARLSIGQRDWRLLALREMMFGSRIEGVVACPECGERLELIFDATEIRTENAPGTTHLLKVGGYELNFRPPNSTDLEAIADCRNAAEARERLLTRCASEIRRGGKTSKKSIAQLPAKVVDALVEKMAQIDPQANVQLKMNCPACRHDWLATFDIAAYLWSEIDDWAQRMLREIHIIASTYGWREADILELNAERRNFYLEMIGGN